MESHFQISSLESLIFNAGCIFSGWMYRSHSFIPQEDYFLCSCWWLWLSLSEGLTHNEAVPDCSKLSCLFWWPSFPKLSLPFPSAHLSPVPPAAWRVIWNRISENKKKLISDKNTDFGAKNSLFLFCSVLPFKTRTGAERTEREGLLQ